MIFGFLLFKFVQGVVHASADGADEEREADKSYKGKNKPRQTQAVHIEESGFQ